MKNVFTGSAMVIALLASGAALAQPSTQVTGASAGGGGGVVVGALGGAGAFGYGTSTSSVNGSFGAGLSGPGSIQGSYTSGNQSYADTNVSVGATQSNGTTAANSTVTGSPGSTSNSSGFSQSASVGFSIGSQSGSENFGSADFSSMGMGSWVDLTSNANGTGTGSYKGGEGLVGGGAAGGIGFDGTNANLDTSSTDDNHGGGMHWGNF